MGKASRHNEHQKKRASRASQATTVRRRQHSQLVKNVAAPKSNTARSQTGKQHQQRQVKLPFHASDNVLLVGEGDFSFALSLARQNLVSTIVATSYDNLEALKVKYPNIDATLKSLAKHEADADQQASQKENTDNEWNGFSPGNSSSEDGQAPRIGSQTTILHGIDAKALSTKHKKALTKHAPFTKIIFNFPHTGGLSTDVNRQVRANQDLLVEFFNSAKPLLATSKTPAQFTNSTEDNDIDDWDPEETQRLQEETEVALATGRILVSLFEGEPYTLWNIRDLARHCGLQVIESFSFPWTAFPGYKHARTIGDITTGKDRADEGKRKGAWRGEERAARCFVLGLKDEATQQRASAKKRKHQQESDESD